MAAPQVHITTPDGNILATASAIRLNNRTKEQELNRVKKVTQTTLIFLVTGVCSLVLGSADLAVGIVATVSHSVVSQSFSYAWGGFVFGLVDGSLAIRASRSSGDHDLLRWLSVVHGFGVAAIVIHFVDLGLAVLSCAEYGGLSDFQLTVKSSATQYFYFSPATSEAARVTVVAVLIAMEVFQVVIADKLRRFLQNERNQVRNAVTYVSAIAASQQFQSESQLQSAENAMQPPPYSSVELPAYEIVIGNSQVSD